MKKLLVSDYDQTFYLDDFDIEKNKKAVTKFKSKKNIFDYRLFYCERIKR